MADKIPEGPLVKALRESLLPRLLSEGTFGVGWQLETADITPIGGLGQDHFASTTLSVTLELSKGSGRRSLALVVKCMLPGDGFEGYCLPEVQAENEVDMYTKVFPFFERLADGSGLDVSDLHPKCYMAALGVENATSITVMENIRARNFRLAKERTALDLQHVNLFLRAIGRMHALSYAAKARCREEFLEKVAPLARECSMIPDWESKWAAVLSDPFRRGLTRLEARLKKETDVGEKHQQRLDRLRRVDALADNVYAIMVKAAAPKEPVSVIVHGDFCRNNMQFKYDDDGKPIEVCFFDFQNPRYCSPAVDLSFALFLSTSAELRKAHWDDMIRGYFDSLKSTLDCLLKGHEVHKDFVMPTIEMIRQDLRQHSLWGYTICSFFLPQMMFPEDVPAMDKIKELAIADPDAASKLMINVGGEVATEMLADMVLEFLDMDLIPSN